MMGGGHRNKKTSSAGYTIVEVLIFLAITTTLFFMIALTFSSHQGRTQFTAGARDMESKLQDIINDVSTGFYSRPGDFSCSGASATGPIVGAGGTGQGENQGCVFIGRAVHFNIEGEPDENYKVYTMAALREVQIGSINREAQNFAEAQPIIVAPPSSPEVGLTDTDQLTGGMTIHDMYYDPPVGPNVPLDAVAFFSSFGSYDNSGVLTPGALTVRVIPIVTSSLGTGGPPPSTQTEVVNGVAAITDPYVAFVSNPQGKTVICMNSGGSRQYAELSLGGNGRDLATDLRILDGTCP